MNQTEVKDGKSRTGGDSAPILEISGLCAAYGKHRVIEDIDLVLRQGDFLGLLGHNGAGKTTLMKCILGLVRTSKGEIRLNGRSVTGRQPAANVAAGISMVPQGDIVFPSMTVQEHLQLSGTGSAAAQRERTDHAFDLFPILKERRNRPAGHMSGGQRQMLGIACALVQSPQVMLLDEPSTGLAPLLVEQVLDAITRINSELNTSVIVVEQDAPRIMRHANRIQIIKLGRTVFQGTPEELRSRDWVDLF